MLARIADRIAERVAGQLKGFGGGAKGGNGRRAGGKRGARAGRKLDMSCRVDGCKNTSKGPRFGFMCEEHLKSLSKKEQKAASEAWKAKHAA